MQSSSQSRLFFLLVSSLWSQLSLNVLFSLWVYSNVCLKWVHTNCIWSGRVPKHKQTQTHKLTKRGISGQIRSSYFKGPTGLVNPLCSHTGKQWASMLWTDVWAHSHICIYQIFSDPTHASVLSNELIFMACTWLCVVFTGLLIGIFIQFALAQFPQRSRASGF